MYFTLKIMAIRNFTVAVQTGCREIWSAAPALKEKLWHILEGQLRDNKKAHILKPDGSYEKVDGRGKEPYCAQEVFCKEAQEMSVKKEYRDTRVFIPETHVEME